MSEKRQSGHFTATSGAMFLASYLSYKHSLHVEVTRDNAPFVDLLATSEDGVFGTGIQVKVANQARRYSKGEIVRFEWDTNKGIYYKARPDLLVALVDLKEWQETPDFYFVTAQHLKDYYSRVIEQRDGREPSRWMYHEHDPSVLLEIKNDPSLLLERLSRRRAKEDNEA